MTKTQKRNGIIEKTSMWMDFLLLDEKMDEYASNSID